MYVECQYASNAAAALYKLYSTLDKDLEMLAMQLLRTPEKKVWQCHSALYRSSENVSHAAAAHTREKYELNYSCRLKDAPPCSGQLRKLFLIRRSIARTRQHKKPTAAASLFRNKDKASA